MARKSSNFNLNDASTWNSLGVVFFGLLFAVALFFIVYNFFVTPKLQEIDSNMAKIDKQKNEYTKNKALVELIPRLKKEVAEWQIAKNEAKKYLPTDISMPQLIDNVYLAAQDNGIVFNKFTPEGDINQKFYTIKPITLSTNVGFSSMSSFIEQVTALKRIMNIQSVSFKTPNSRKGFAETPNSPLQMTAQLRTYIFKDDTKIESKSTRR